MYRSSRCWVTTTITKANSKAYASTWRRSGITVLEGEGTIVAVDGVRVGIAGTKGFGGGFRGSVRLGVW